MRYFASLRHYYLVTYYERRLPHWHPDGAFIFVTWRLRGSLPRGKASLSLKAGASQGERFAALDRHLDRAVEGPAWLRDPRIASCVVNAISDVERRWDLCEVAAWVIMPNHVHLLVRPRKTLAQVTMSIKKNSAREANLILNRCGTPFWQDESYDHWVRDEKEFGRIVRYIEWNPVRAGFVRRPEEWVWSSAGYNKT